MTDTRFPYGARILWGRGHDTIQAWDQVSIWGLETFGLPGDRYITDLNILDMTWWFRTDQDRTLFVLRNGSAECVQLELTT